MVSQPEQETSTAGVLSRSWYCASIAEFLQTQPDTIVGRLARNNDFALLPTQKDAWLAQIGLLKTCLIGLTGSLFFEFNIPRMGRRIDVVLLIGPVVFVIEFKVGESAFERTAVDQVWDYALDLKNFHEASHFVSIVPILIATGATESAPLKLRPDEDKVYRPILGYAMKVPFSPLPLAELSIIQAALAARITGFKRNKLYEYVLTLKASA